MKKVLVIGTFVMLFCTGWKTFGGSLSDRIVNEISVSPGQTLILDLDTGGDLVIQGRNKNSVSVNADLAKAKDCCVFEMEKVSGGVRVHSGPKYPNQIQTYSSNFRFEIDVPESFNIALNSAGGDVKIARLNGQMKGSTGGGEIAIRDSKGVAHLSTGGGDIHISDSHLDGEVSTGAGDIRFNDVSGDIEGSSGSGNVIRNQAPGKPNTKTVSFQKHSGGMNITKSGGEIEIDNAPDGIEASTGGGDIHIGSAKLRVAVQTGGGDVRIDAVDGEVEATTGAGDIIVNLKTTTNSSSHDVDLSSGTGDITLIVPPSFSMQVDLKIGYTNERDRNDIISDFPVQKTYTQKWSEVEGTARKYIYGTGNFASGKNRIRISTVNGSIYLKKTASNE